MPILTAEERIGTTLAGRYRVDALLGQGGMGVVLAATHELTERRVALKLLLPGYGADADLVARFFQEAKAAAALNHPNVVDVLDMGQEGEDAYLVLELLEGKNLGDLLEERGKVPPGELLKILLPVMDALAAAHERGIVHRDLKPDNIFIHRDLRNRAIPKVLDFGIAKLLDGNSDVKTRTGGLVGTPHYMSPEQAQGLKDAGGQSDVWSMGVLIYECLAGERPFAADSVPALLLQICTFDPIPLSHRVPELDPRLCEVIQRSLKRELDQRFQTMEEFGGALVAAARDAGIELPSSMLELFQEAQTVARASSAGPSGRPSTGPIDSSEVKLRIGTDPTLAAGSDAVAEAVPAKKSPPVLMIGVALVALLAVGGGLFVALGGPHHEPERPSVEASTEEAPVEDPAVAETPRVEEPPAEETPAEEPPAEERPAAPAPLVRTIESTPSGADVYRDGERIGTTPLEVTVPPDGDGGQLELRLRGYRNQGVSVSEDSPSPIAVSLRPRPTRPTGGGSDLAPR